METVQEIKKDVLEATRENAEATVKLDVWEKIVEARRLVREIKKELAPLGLSFTWEGNIADVELHMRTEEEFLEHKIHMGLSDFAYELFRHGIIDRKPIFGRPPKPENLVFGKLPEGD